MNAINTQPPKILIIDINSCFATVAQQAYSTLRGKPVVVAAYASPKGCILSPSIEAKRYGIKTGMRVLEAQQLCPFVIVREPETGLIRDVHHNLRRLLEQYSPDVVPKSIDEFTVDFTSMGRVLTKDIIHVAQEIKQRVRKEVGDWISTSVGIAPNRFLAKLASGLKKPDGLVTITHENILDVYSRINLIDFPGINVRMQIRLAQAHIYTPLDLFNASALTLKKFAFRSILGYQWYLRLRGWEADRVEFTRKSFGQDYAMSEKTADPDKLKRLLLKLCEKMGRRLRRHGYQAQGVHVALLYTDGTFWHHGRKTKSLLYTTAELYQEILYTLKMQLPQKEVGKIMVRCYDLVSSPSSQPTLFDVEDKKRKVSEALDKVNDRYGEFTLVPARMLNMDKTIVDRIAFGKAGIGEMQKIEGGFFHSPDLTTSSEDY